MKLFIINLIIMCFGFSDQRIFAATAPRVNPAAIARAKFISKQYDEAIALLHRHLRAAPSDYNAWNLLGASYYYTGQPRRALKTLKKVERLTPEKSYNYYHQGLCLLALSEPNFESELPTDVAIAKQYFTFAAQRYRDEYAGRATFELGVIEYKSRSQPRATYWLNQYLQRFPRGVYTREALTLLASLKTGQWIAEVEGTKKPDMEDALFKYSDLSLSEKKHYWFVQAGGEYTDHAGQEPKPNGKIGARNYQDMAGNVNAGVGIGPWKEGSSSAFAGYTYRQHWVTDNDRLQEWLSEPTDIRYFPLRGDLMERRHQFYADFRRDFAKIFYAGVFGRYELARIGSSQFPSPDSANLRRTLKISDTQLVIPWIGASLTPNIRSLAYLYLRKELNDDLPDHSNKTYSLGLQGSAGNQLSFGISTSFDLPERRFSGSIELFQYNFIYNDLWLDYKRTGAIASAAAEVISRWTVKGSLGLYRDEYVLPRIKTLPCSSVPDVGSDATGSATGNLPHPCTRTDTGTLIQAQLQWDMNQFNRIAGMVQFVQNKNVEQKEFDENKQSYIVTYTMAFPSVKRTERYTERFADAAFTKEAE